MGRRIKNVESSYRKTTGQLELERREPFGNVPLRLR